jgi:hypothetical protein
MTNSTLVSALGDAVLDFIGNPQNWRFYLH